MQTVECSLGSQHATAARRGAATVGTEYRVEELRPSQVLLQPLLEVLARGVAQAQQPRGWSARLVLAHPASCSGSAALQRPAAEQKMQQPIGPVSAVRLPKDGPNAQESVPAHLPVEEL